MDVRRVVWVGAAGVVLAGCGAASGPVGSSNPVVTTDDPAPVATSVTADGRQLTLGTWELRSPTRPSDVTVELVVDELACAGNNPPADRVRPDVTYGDDEIVVDIWFELVGEGEYTCIGLGPVEYELSLAEAIGGREIVPGTSRS